MDPPTPAVTGYDGSGQGAKPRSNNPPTANPSPSRTAPPTGCHVVCAGKTNHVLEKTAPQHRQPRAIGDIVAAVLHLTPLEYRALPKFAETIAVPACAWHPRAEQHRIPASTKGKRLLPPAIVMHVGSPDPDSTA
jgi:hypothetical protein